MAAAVSNVEAEIKQLKEKFGQDCHVICDVGDFTHVVSIAFKKWDVKLKFQITGDYPDVRAELIVSGSNNADDAMMSRLDQFLKNDDQTDKSLVDNALVAKQWLEDNGILPAVVLPTSAKKPKVKRNKKSAENDETTDKTKKKMRTASDVIQRIQWQKELKAEDFTVGYLDRFLGVQEKEFGAFSWDDIATVDDYAVFAIPKHRIQYFKYRGTVIWDKTARLDNVFGSTGSGIKLLSFVDDPDGHQAESTCVPDKAEDSSSEEHSNDDDDDGIMVTVASSDKTAAVPHAAAKLEHPVMPPIPQRQQNRRRPNYFVCQRITAPAIMKGVQEVQSKIMKAAPAFYSCFIDPSSLHMTICTLTLDHETQVAAACRILHQARSDLSTLAGRGINIHVTGVGHFYDRVLVAHVNQSPALTEYVGTVRTLLDSFIADRYEFNPHVTILKLTKWNDRVVSSDRVPRWLYSKFRNTYFGDQPVSTIDLCAMSHYIERPPGQFYITPLHMDLL